jgi:PIN domain nuclease of toxin-antitoxin system
MKVLLDTHIALAVIHRDVTRYGKRIEALIDSDDVKVVSVASVWEIAIKHRLGKLDIDIPLERVCPFFEMLGYDILVVDASHAVENLDTAPRTNDPFDRLLLAQCQVEGLRLVTVDSVLVGHPLAWRP